MSSSIQIGNAPVSYGAFERTVGIDDDVPEGKDVLDAVASAGYRGIDLGPPGYLGSGAALGRDLADRGLLLTGAYLEVDVASEAGKRRGMAELVAMLDLFDSLDPPEPVLQPRPTVAIVAGEVSTDLVPEADAAIWQAAISVLKELTSVARDRGYEACLHNEVGTLAAGPAQLEAAAEQAGVSLCVDTGHLLVAGGDPVDLLRRLQAIVGHVHVKDVSPEGLELMAAPGAVATDVWEKSAFCRLGAGVGRIADIAAFLLESDYSGWVVVEQDVLPRGSGGYRRAADDQVANRAYLRRLGL
jgi:inosose dehydratase